MLVGTKKITSCW